MYLVCFLLANFLSTRPTWYSGIEEMSKCRFNSCHRTSYTNPDQGYVFFCLRLINLVMKKTFQFMNYIMQAFPSYREDIMDTLSHTFFSLFFSCALESVQFVALKVLVAK